MSRRADATNRAVLSVIGLLLVVGGGLGLALSVGAFGATRATYPVLLEAARDFPEEQPWFWWALAAVCVLVAVLALRWLLAQTRTDRASRLDRTADARDGYTTLRAGALTAAVEDDVGDIPGVSGASARVIGRSQPRLTLRVEIADSADIDTVCARLEDSIVPRIRGALDDPDFPISVELRPGVEQAAARSVA